MSEKASDSKRYSVTRVPVGASGPYCQSCSSTSHWTYECTATEKKKGSRLSASQLLRLGIKRKRVELIPEMTEREKFTADLQQIKKEIHQEMKDSKAQRQKERKVESNNATPTDVKEEKDDPTAFPDKLEENSHCNRTCFVSSDEFHSRMNDVENDYAYDIFICYYLFQNSSCWEGFEGGKNPPTKPSTKSSGKAPGSTGASGKQPATPQTSTGMTSATMYGKWNQSEIEKYFEFLKQGEMGDHIGAKGLETLVRELKMEWMSFEMLVLMWKLRATRLGVVTRGEWNLAMYDSGITQQLHLRSKVNEWISEARNNKETFTEMYNFLYDYLRGENIRWMESETAVRSWNVLIPNNPIVKQWCQWVETVYRSEISRDVWQQFWQLLCVHPQLNDYEVDGKWPTALDDFVAWQKLNNQLRFTSSLQEKGCWCSYIQCALALQFLLRY
eukprot:gene4423-3222_t